MYVWSSPPYLCLERGPAGLTALKNNFLCGLKINNCRQEQKKTKFASCIKWANCWLQGIGTPIFLYDVRKRNACSIVCVKIGCSRKFMFFLLFLSSFHLHKNQTLRLFHIYLADEYTLMSADLWSFKPESVCM